jgi:replicative DNA helicase
MKAGHDVLYITMEMSEEMVHERVDANLLNVATDDLKKMSKKDFMSKVKSIKDKTNGRLFVKEYPTSSAHAGHFRHLIKELKQKKKFKPAVIFIDYINICASSRYKSLSGVNSYSYIKAIAEELRALAVEFDVPIMTATQTNRGAANEDSPDMTATSESIGLPQSLDWFIAVTTNEVLMENNQQLFHLLKTRWGAKQSVKPQLVSIDWSKMRYSDVGSTKEVQNAVGNRSEPTKKTKKRETKAIDFD